MAEPVLPGRVLALDLGTRRVGRALSDPLRIAHSPLDAVPLESEPALVRDIARFCAQKAVAVVVIGLPVSADGSEGTGCARARRVAAGLRAAGITTALQDESWSSRDAEEILRQSGRKRRSKQDREKVDAVAASLILREYLQGASST